MTHLAAILATERALVRCGVHPATAADAARSAWLAAWERAAGREDAPGLRGSPLYLAARRLSTLGRAGAARATAPLPSVDVAPEGRDPAEALDDLLDAASAAGRSPLEMLRRARAAGASFADIGAACGVSGETARAWCANAVEPRSQARSKLCAFVAGLGA